MARKNRKNVSKNKEKSNFKLDVCIFQPKKKQGIQVESFKTRVSTFDD